uniref:Homeobox domain-containing protein n=1 Tax=Rhabditophanes sp. KR3021 TaxID=114890 RepID=A0AC35UCG3_9BILA
MTSSLLLDISNTNPIDDMLKRLMEIADEPLEDNYNDLKFKVTSHPSKNALYQVFCEMKGKTHLKLEIRAPEEDEDPQLMRLDNMLVAEGIADNVKSDIVGIVPGNDQSDYKQKLLVIKGTYVSELDRYVKISDEFSSHVRTLLREQSLIRPISITEIQQMVNAICRKFTGIQIQLKQHTCESIMSLKSRFLDARRKRRNFSKQSVDLLNEYFYNHLANPYPSEDIKEELARQCNITVSQVSNWFGNKRIRYKKGIAKNQDEASMYGKKAISQVPQISQNPYSNMSNMLAANPMNPVNSMGGMNPMMNPYAAMMSAQGFPQLGPNGHPYPGQFMNYGGNLNNQS